MLTGLIWCREPGDADRFVSALVKAGVAALAAGEALGPVPAEVIQACGRHGVALVAVPPETSFAAVTEEVGRRLSGDRATAMTRVLGRRRLLLSAVAEGAGLDAMFRLMGRELAVECWLLSGLGRIVGGTGDAAPGDTASAAHLFAAAIRGAQAAVESDRSRIRLTAGISATAEGVIALSGAWHEASSARRLAALRGGTATAVVTSDEVASHELLLATVAVSVLRSFRERLLGPLVAYDDRHRAELLPTLREYLACSGSWNVCAAKMYVHVNTVRYRIRRIEELTGRDLSSLDDQVDFFLALRIR